ncbi:MAG: flippase [Clostridia bacterium]|nr:flippase [Clostridia bacterium]
MIKRSIKVNTVFSILKSVSSVIFPLITFPYISRVLLPDNVGKISFSNSYVNYFLLLATLGVTAYAVRELSRVREDKKAFEKLAGQIFSINVITMAVAYLCLFLSLIFLRPLDDYRDLIILQSSLLLCATVGTDWVNSAMEDFSYITIRAIAFQLISLVAMFLFVREPDDYVIYAFISVFPTGGANILNLWYCRRFCKIRFTLHPDWKRHFSPILQLFVMQLAQVVFSNADILMLGLIHSDYEVGVYTVAVRIYTILTQLLASVFLVVLPRLSAYYGENDYEKINPLLRKILGFLVAFGFPCLVGTACLSREIVTIIGGEAYLGAAPVLQLLMVALFFALLGGNFIGNVILIPSRREKTFLYVCCITAVLNVVLNGILIPFLGILGAAIATAASSFAIFAMLLPSLEKEIRLGKMRTLFLLPLLGCAWIVLVAVLCNLLIGDMWIRIFCTVGASVAGYGAILWFGKYELVASVWNAVLSKFRKKGESVHE